MSKQQRTTPATANEDPNILRFARMHWAWLKKNDPAFVINGVGAGRMALFLRRVGIQGAAELQRRVSGGEKPAGVEADILATWIEPTRDGQPTYHAPELAVEAAKEFEASEEGAPFLTAEKAKG